MNPLSNTTAATKMLGYVGTEAFTEKPETKKPYGILRSKSAYFMDNNNLVNEWSVEKIADLVGNKGHSFQHGTFLHTQDTFSSSQFIRGNVIFVDIDKGNFSIDEVLTKCSPFTPSIIYHTLTSGIDIDSKKPDDSIKKYRVMWLLDKPVETENYKRITTFFISRLSGDSACKDAARLILGGKNLCFSSTAILSLETLLIYPEYINFESPTSKKTPASEMKNKLRNSTESHKSAKKVSDSIEMNEILARMKKMHLKTKPTLLTDKTSFEWINSLPLDYLLDLPFDETFSCIMPAHPDHHPSAVILSNDKSQQVYFCHSCPSVPMQYAKSVLGLLEVLSGWNVIDLQKEILRTFNIRYQTEHQLKGLDTIHHNRIIISEAIDDERFVKLKKKGLLHAYLKLLDYVESNLPEIPITSDEIELFASFGHIAAFLKKEYDSTKSVEALKRYINGKTTSLNTYEFIRKVQYKDLPERWLSKTVELQSQNEHYRKITYWQIHKLTTDTLIRSIDMIAKEEACGYRMSNLSITKIASQYGNEFASKIFNQQHYDKEQFEKDEQSVTEIVHAIVRHQSYYTRKMIHDNCGLKAKTVDSFLPGITTKLGYREVCINNELRLQLNISEADLKRSSKLFIKDPSKI